MAVTDSILDTIKKMLGIPLFDTAFDSDIIVNINAVFSILSQLGVGSVVAFSISNAEATWAQFSADETVLNLVKTYIYLKVRMIFDLPTTSFAISAITSLISELEWRLNVLTEPEPIPEPVVPDGD